MEKWTPELWLTSSLAELYAGTEDITSPAASALLSQAFPPTLTNSEADTDEALVIFDNGTGLGQLVEVLLSRRDIRRGIQKVVAGDVDEGLLASVKNKKDQYHWNEVEVKKVDTHAIDLPDDTFTHVFANFVYMLMPDPLQALKESIRVLKPGGCIGFTTWSSSGPLFLLKEALSLVSDVPAPPAPPKSAPSSTEPTVAAPGTWTDREYILSTLNTLQLENIAVEEYTFKQTAKEPRDMARKMRPVVPLMIKGWSDELKKEKAWDIFLRIEDIMRRKFGNAECWVESKAWIVTATKANAA